MSIVRLNSETRREQIAQAALALVADKGLDALNMAALARGVGLGTSSLYRHFASKDEVLDAVLDLLEGKLLGNVEKVLGETRDPVDRLRRLLALHMRLILEVQALPRLFFSGDLYAGAPGRKRRLYGIITTYLGKIAEIIRQGQTRGRLRADLDPESLSVVFLGLIQPTAILWHLSDGEFDVGRQVERAWPFFLDALATGARE